MTTTTSTTSTATATTRKILTTDECIKHQSFYQLNNHHHHHQYQQQRQNHQEVLDVKNSIQDNIKFLNFDSLSKRRCTNNNNNNNKTTSSIMAVHNDTVIDDVDVADGFVIVPSNCNCNSLSSSNKSILNKDIRRVFDDDYGLDDGDLDDDDDDDEDEDEEENSNMNYENQICILNHDQKEFDLTPYLINSIDHKNVDDDRDSLVGTSASDEELDHSCDNQNDNSIKMKFKNDENNSINEYYDDNNNKNNYNEDDDDDGKKPIILNNNNNEQQILSSPEPSLLQQSYTPDTIESSDCDQHYHFTMDATTTYSTNSSQNNLASLSPLPINKVQNNNLLMCLTSTINSSLDSTTLQSNLKSSKLDQSMTKILERSINNKNEELNDSSISSSSKQQQQSLLYPPSSTLASIRDALSHITRLDDFNVVKLSHGFFSQVFKVTHLRTRKIMVLKMNKNPSNRGNALKEIELLNKLNHINIVAYLGTVVHEGGLHPLLEYINGGTLEQLITKYYSTSNNNNNINDINDKQLSNICYRNVTSTKVHRLLNPDQTFVKLMQDVCRGMAYLHSQGYLHRDLASKNIFIRKQISSDKDFDEFDDERLEAVIGDFGFAAVEPKSEQKLPTVGSPYWLAPECLNNKWYNHKCDIFSFGVICCELNWHIPSDPDFLPRLKNYSIDFAKLDTTPMNTLLAKIAMKACQYEPSKRPEFHELLTIFDNNDDLKSTEKQQRQLRNSDNKRIERENFSLQLPRAPFKRFNSLDSSLVHYRQNNNIESISGSDNDEENQTDVFEQHLLRRRDSALNQQNSWIVMRNDLTYL